MTSSLPSSSRSSTPQSLPATGEAPQSAGLDLGRVFGDPMMTETAANDPVLKFISSSWRSMVYTVAAALIIFYAVNLFRANYAQSLADAGDSFSRMQREYDGYVAKQSELTTLSSSGTAEDKKKVEALTAELTTMRSRLDASLLALSDARAPYSQLAQTYQQFLSKGSAAIISGTTWKDIPASRSSERLFAELQALTVARSSIPAPESLATLTELIQNGEYVHTTAAITLATVARSSEERARARELLQKLLEKRPEQADLVTPELTRLTP